MISMFLFHSFSVLFVLYYLIFDFDNWIFMLESYNFYNIKIDS
jgi:hypothetical protein